jgi:hypothetical protein
VPYHRLNTRLTATSNWAICLESCQDYCASTPSPAQVEAHSPAKVEGFLKESRRCAEIILYYTQSACIVIFNSGPNPNLLWNEKWRVARKFSVVHACKLCTQLLVNTSSSVHKTRHRGWNVSTVLCSTQRYNFRRRCLSPDDSPCIGWEMWWVLVDRLSCTTSSTSTSSRELRLPRPARACGTSVTISLRYDASF